MEKFSQLEQVSLTLLSQTKKIFNAFLCLSIISLWLLSLKESAMKPRSNFSGEVRGNCSSVEVRFCDIAIIYNGTCFSFSSPRFKF